MHGFLVGAPLALAVNQQAAIPGNIVNRHRSILIGAQLGGVNQAIICALPALAHIDRTLVLTRQPLGKEVLPAAQRRHGVLIDSLQFGELLDDLRTILQLG